MSLRETSNAIYYKRYSPPACYGWTKESGRIATALSAYDRRDEVALFMQERPIHGSPGMAGLVPNVRPTAASKDVHARCKRPLSPDSPCRVLVSLDEHYLFIIIYYIWPSSVEGGDRDGPVICRRRKEWMDEAPRHTRGSFPRQLLIPGIFDGERRWGETGGKP